MESQSCVLNACWSPLPYRKLKLDGDLEPKLCSSFVFCIVLHGGGAGAYRCLATQRKAILASTTQSIFRLCRELEAPQQGVSVSCRESRTSLAGQRSKI